MLRIAILVSMIAAPALADVKGSGGRIVECYCTDTQGARIELGERICLKVDGRAFIAQCDMSLNVPIWRDTGVGCLTSSLDQPEFNFSKPAVQSFPISAKVGSG